MVVDWALVGTAVLVIITAVILSGVVLAIYATFASAQTFPAAYAPRWILIGWLLPVIGPLATLRADKKFKQAQMQRLANKPDAANPAIASRLHSEHSFRGVADPER